MGASWFVRPETSRLLLSEGQWLLVKQRLTAGEFRAHIKRSSRMGDDGVRRLHFIDHHLSRIVAYLLDWSLEANIRGVSEQDLTATLDGLDPQRSVEISAAVGGDETAMTAAREEKKTTTPGETAAGPASPPACAPAPALPSPNAAPLTSMSMPSLSR